MIGLSRQPWGGLVSNPTLALLSSTEVLSPGGGFDIQAAVPWITKAHVLQPPGFPATPVSFRRIDSGGAEALIHLQGKEIVLDILIKQCSFAAFRIWWGWGVCVCVCVCVTESFNDECQTLVGSISWAVSIPFCLQTKEASCQGACAQIQESLSTMWY